MDCCIDNCLSSKDRNPNRLFFSLPRSMKIREQWLHLICREDLLHEDNNKFYVCDLHFNPIDLITDSKSKQKILKLEAVPCYYLPSCNTKKDATTRPITTTTKVLDKHVQTDIFYLSNKIQTPGIPPSNISRKSKLKSDLLECRKVLKLFNIGEPRKRPSDAFFKLCNKYLTKEFVDLIKAQSRLRYTNPGNKGKESYITACLDFYYANPQAYQAFQNVLSLPSIDTLIKYEKPITTRINERQVFFLKTKIKHMTDEEKQCSLIVNSMTLKTNLFYNIGQDKLIGFQEVDDVVPEPKPAQLALVVMIRGIFANWTQPVGYVLLAARECVRTLIDRWIHKLLETLTEIGFDIRTIVTDVMSDWIGIARKEYIKYRSIYKNIGQRKIYVIFDTPHLIKLARNCLMAYNISFEGHVAKYEDIIEFYNHNKQARFNLAPQLTDSHIYPSNLEKKKVCYATELFDNSVAAAISTYVDLNIIHKSGKGTAKFIKAIRNLYDTLNSSKIQETHEFKRAFCFEKSQLNFLREMLTFFQSLRITDPKTGCDVTQNINFTKGFQITILSILQLAEELRSEGYKYLLTNRLNQSTLDLFFEQIKSQMSKPTPRQFIRTFKKQFYSNIIMLSKSGNSVTDLRKFVQDAETIVQYTDSPTEISRKAKEKKEKETDDLEFGKTIKASEYNQEIFLIKTKPVGVYIYSRYLLVKCSDRHKNCRAFRKYTDLDMSQSSRYILYINDAKNLASVPREFISFVEAMDNKFRGYFNTTPLDTSIVETLYEEIIKKIKFERPCRCFPIAYVVKLFIRMRLFSVLKYNNDRYRKVRNSRGNFYNIEM